jgi:peptidoglycan/xylan/chitin deacetylase (PgdA/CDA1 family)
MTARLLGRRVQTLVLLYHRVTELGRDPYRLAVSPERFARQLEVLRARFELVPLPEALTPATRTRAVITFDDGYHDNAGTALELLRARDAPATMFVVAGAVGSATGFWWDRLEHVFAAPLGRPVFELEVGGRPLRADLRTPEARARAHLAVYHRLRRLPLGELEESLAEIADALGTPADAPSSHRPISEEELRELAGSKLVEIGAHTVTHPALSRLATEEKRAEIAGSRERLEQLTGVPVRSFSYPHGAHDPESVRLVREAGFIRACASIEGSVSRRTEPFLLPRRVVLDWDAAELERRLDAWTAE